MSLEKKLEDMVIEEESVQPGPPTQPDEPEDLSYLQSFLSGEFGFNLLPPQSQGASQPDQPESVDLPNLQSLLSGDGGFNPYPPQLQNLPQPGPSTQSDQQVDIPNSQSALSGDGGCNPLPLQSQSVSQPGPSGTQPEQSQGVKKKQGRPPKKNKPVRLPTRVSQREKKAPKVLTYDNPENCSGEWSERDKKLFLSGCLKVGTEDIEGLKSFLPHRTESEIKKQIAYWKELAMIRVERTLVEEKDKQITNLDEWITYFKNKIKSSKAPPCVLENIFLIYAEYGKLPTPEECGGVDFRAMYRWLHCMINGIPPYGLNQKTAQLLCKCIDNVLDKLQNSEMVDNLADHLLDMKHEEFKRKFKKTYRRKEKYTSSIEAIVASPTLNPLELPVKALSKDANESSDED